MKKTILNIALVAFITLGATSCKEKEKEAQETAETTEMSSGVTANFSVDTASSVIEWSGSKPLGKHEGTIQVASGEFNVVDGKITEGKFMIDMNTITDKDLEGQMKENLESHLKGTVEGKEGDFFNVNMYPFATFVMKSISEVDGVMTVQGNLTIKDKTNPVEFPVTISEDGDNMTLKSEKFAIDRTKWGVNYGSKSVFDNLGDKFINDDIELTINVVGKKS